MRNTVKSLMVWLTEKRIRLDCMHIPGVENTKADSLSRLSKSGDYSLRNGVPAKAERPLRVKVEIDLFAHTSHTQKLLYCTTKHDRNAQRIEGVQVRSAFHIQSWSHFGVVLALPPIPRIPQLLTKTRQDKTTAISSHPCGPGTSTRRRADS
jgi:hypothetical protein